MRQVSGAVLLHNGGLCDAVPIIVRLALLRAINLARLETCGAAGNRDSIPCSHNFQSYRLNPTLDTSTGVLFL
jgi:hypothetical protein